MSRVTHRILPFVGVALAVALAVHRTANAGPVTVGYTLQITEGLPGGSVSTSMLASRTLVAADRPMFTLSNDSVGADITSFQITIQNQIYSIGSLIFVPQGDSPVTVTDYTPITTPGGHAGSEAAGLVFNGFSEGNVYSFRTDIDRNADHGASLTNYRQALASGPSSDWATIDVTFSDGTTLHQKLTPADVSGGSSTYSFFSCLKNPQPQGQIVVSQQSTPVPEPSTLALAGVGLAGSFLCAARAKWRRGREAPG